MDPEADYNVPEIHFTKDTKVVGEANNIGEIKEGQEVKLWLDEIDGEKVANKIKVFNE